MLNRAIKNQFIGSIFTMITANRHKAVMESIPKIHDEVIPIIRAKPSPSNYSDSIEGVGHSHPHTGRREVDISIADDKRDRTTFLPMESIVQIQVLRDILKELKEIKAKL